MLGRRRSGPTHGATPPTKLSPCGAGPPASSRCPRRAGPRPTASHGVLIPPTRLGPHGGPSHAPAPPRPRHTRPIHLLLPAPDTTRLCLPQLWLAALAFFQDFITRPCMPLTDTSGGAPTATAAGQPLTLRRVPREAPSQLRSSPPRTTLVTSPSVDDGRSMKGCAIRRGAGAGLSPQTQPQRNGL